MKVLVVDDNDCFRQCLADLLVSEGHEVWTANSAETGLELLTAQTFTLVVTDYQMPGHTGTWMVKTASARGLLRDTRVLMVTGDGSPERIPALRVLQKPLDASLFIRTVADLFASPARASTPTSLVPALAIEA